MLASAKAADFTTEMIGSKVRLWGCHDVDLRSNRVKETDLDGNVASIPGNQDYKCNARILDR